MIPYDDLVSALAAWRERQGLPVTMPQAAAAAPPVRGQAAPAAPAGPAPAEIGDLEDGALLEDAGYDAAGYDAAGYDAASDGYAMQLGEVTVEQPGETTAIGGAPEPPPGRRGKRTDGW